MKYYVSKSNDPAFNIALEEYCFKQLRDIDEIFLLWINDIHSIRDIGKNIGISIKIYSGLAGMIGIPTSYILFFFYVKSFTI